MVRLTAAALCAAFTLSLAPAHAQEPASKSDSAPTIKVDTRLVIVPVIVRDKKGQLVRNLKQTDFTLSENNKPQTIKYFDKDSEAPLTVGLLVDVSGSVRNVLDEERTASSAFLDTLLRPDKDKAFIVQFGHQADLLADVTSSLPKLEAGLKKIDADTDRPQFSGSSQQQDPNSGSGNTQDNGNNNGGYGGRGGGRRGGQGGGNYRGGGTVLYDAIYLSSNEVINKQPPAAKQTNREALILLTDGDDRGSKESISSAIEAAQRTNATVYAIYFKGEEHNGGGFPGGGRRGGMGGGFPGMGGGWPGGGGGGRNGGGGQGRGGEQRVDGKKILQRICDETGGRVFEVSSKQHIDDIYKQISEELRSEYRLGFTPTDTSEGYHRVLVDLPNDKKSTIQARDGYYIGAAQ
ncbi:VWA domain-containing protein [Terriglobus aquaticus]|uniref:VWA domain-containing protein n=1 Tax=Terriglobus aquaticus TaxID=940139 RepID=A0ABW9KFH8_9BACT|nr:VWA domain-containing protein [Terriglobus aquaticus]